MNEIEGILNSSATWECLLIDYSIYCPFRANYEISCGQCMWRLSSPHREKLKDLIPILLID